MLEKLKRFTSALLVLIFLSNNALLAFATTSKTETSEATVTTATQLIKSTEDGVLENSDLKSIESLILLEDESFAKEFYKTEYSISENSISVEPEFMRNNIDLIQNDSLVNETKPVEEGFSRFARALTNEPKIEIVSITDSEFTIESTFPEGKAFGNQINVYPVINGNVKRDIADMYNSNSGDQEFQNSDLNGSHVIKNLNQSRSYIVQMCYFDKTNPDSSRVYIEKNVTLNYADEELITTETENLSISLEKYDMNVFESGKFDLLVTTLDNAYKTYKELFGIDKEHKLVIKSERGLPESLIAYMGEELIFNQDYIYDKIIYEYNLGHVDNIISLLGYSYTFPTTLSNWNLPYSIRNLYEYFAVEQNNVNIRGNGTYSTYVGEEYAHYYKEKYDTTIGNGTYSDYGLTYTLIKIKEQIGVEPFKATFRELLDISKTNSEVWKYTELEKVNIFLTLLSKNSGKNVVDMLTESELSVYEERFGEKLKVTMETDSDIKILVEKDNNGVVRISDSINSIAGTVTSETEIKSVIYELTTWDLEKFSGKAIGTNSWKIEDLPIKPGTNNCIITAIDIKGNVNKYKFIVDKLSTEIEIANDVFVASDKEEAKLIEDGISDSYIDDKGTEDGKDDELVLVVTQNNPLLVALQENKVNVGEILYLEPSEKFVGGFSARIKSISDSTNNPKYPSDSYELIYTEQVGFSDIFTSDVRVDFSTIDKENPILFSSLPENSEITVLQNQRSVNLARNVSEPGVNWDNIFESVVVLTPEVTNEGFHINLKLDEAVWYDEDGDTDNTVDDQILVSGSVDMTDIKITAGMEYHPVITSSQKKELVPEQLICLIEYNLEKELEIKSVGADFEFNTQEVLEDEFGQGFDDEGLSLLGDVINFSGVDMTETKVLPLWVVAIKPVSKAIYQGTAKNIQGQSRDIKLEPIIIIAPVLGLDGKFEIDASIGMSQVSHHVSGVNIQQYNHIGSYGSLDTYKEYLNEDNPPKDFFGMGIWEIQNFDYNKAEEPEITLKAEGKATANARCGGAVGVMLAGQVPILLQIGLNAEMEIDGIIDAEATINIADKSLELQDGTIYDFKIGFTVALLMEVMARFAVEMVDFEVSPEVNLEYEYIMYKKQANFRAEGDPEYNLQGTIFDYLGKELKDINIHIKRDDPENDDAIYEHSVTSINSGYYEFADLKRGNYTITISGDNYFTKVIKITPTQLLKSKYDIILENNAPDGKRYLYGQAETNTKLKLFYANYSWFVDYPNISTPNDNGKFGFLVRQNTSYLLAGTISGKEPFYKIIPESSNKIDFIDKISFDVESNKSALIIGKVHPNSGVIIDEMVIYKGSIPYKTVTVENKGFILAVEPGVYSFKYKKNGVESVPKWMHISNNVTDQSSIIMQDADIKHVGFFD